MKRKFFTTIVFSTLLLLSLGQAKALEVEYLEHKVVPDRIIKRGSISVESRRQEDGNFLVLAKYKVKLRFPYLLKFEGEETITIPALYLTESGVLELEQEKTFSNEEISIEHMGRTDYRGFYDCHILKITPRKKKDWVGTVLFHPDVPSIGWAKVDITFSDIPIIKRHTIHSYYPGN